MNLRYIASLIIISTYSFLTFSQENTSTNTIQIEDSIFYNFQLVNTAKPSKKIKIKDIGAYTVTYIEKIEDSISLNKVYYCNGNIRALNDNYLDFDIRNETIEENFKDGSIISSSNDYSSFYYSQNEKPRQIDLNKLVAIDYSSPKRNLIHNIGRASMVISASIALFVAPVISTAYKKKTSEQNAYFYINNNAYFNSIKTGIIGFAIGYPLARFSRFKHYNLTNDKSKNDKNYWYIEKQ